MGTPTDGLDDGPRRLRARGHRHPRDPGAPGAGRPVDRRLQPGAPRRVRGGAHRPRAAAKPRAALHARRSPDRADQRVRPDDLDRAQVEPDHRRQAGGLDPPVRGDRLRDDDPPRRPLHAARASGDRAAAEPPDALACTIPGSASTASAWRSPATGPSAWRSRTSSAARAPRRSGHEVGVPALPPGGRRGGGGHGWTRRLPVDDEHAERRQAGARPAHDGAARRAPCRGKGRSWSSPARCT